jgi:hypothetical protein
MKINFTDENLHEIAKLSGLFTENNYFFDRYDGDIRVIESLDEEGYVMELDTDGSINCIAKYDRCPVSYNGIEIFKYILSFNA